MLVGLSTRRHNNGDAPHTADRHGPGTLVSSPNTRRIGSFTPSTDRDRVSSILLQPPDAHALLVLGHGAGTRLDHPFMHGMADALGTEGIATFRYNYPYSEAGRGGMDAERVRLETVCAAIDAATSAAPHLPRFAGGHSMSGRMTTLAAAQGLIENLHGLVAFAFPLHRAGHPDDTRADHLINVAFPILFVSGTRDRLADTNLLKDTIASLNPPTALELIKDADHGFQVPKRSGRTHQDIVKEVARITADWTSAQTT